MRAAHWLVAVAFFSGAAIVQTWPLVMHPGDHIMGWAPDSYQVIWNLWWVKEATIERLSNPLHTDLLFYPQGSDLYLHTITGVNGGLSIPLQLITGNVLLSWNVLSLTFLTASALGAYALVHRVTNSVWAGLVGGFAFAFSPFVMVHLHGHLNISTTWPIPLFALFLLRFHESGRRREMVALGGVWALLTYNWFEFAIDAALFLGLFVVFETAFAFRRADRHKMRELWVGGAVGVAVWLSVSAPILVPSVVSALSGDYTLRGGMGQSTEFFSADLLALVTPSPLWGPGTSAKAEVPDNIHAVIGGVEGTVFLGILPLLLAAVGVAGQLRSEQRRMTLFWAATLLFFVLMSLGPFLYVGGEKEFSVGGHSFSLSLPFRVYDNIPLIGYRRVPARMIVFATLALAVLSGSGVAVVTERLRGFGIRLPVLVAVAALALVVLEYWNPPVGLSPFTVPAIYRQISADGGNFAVLDLPVGRITGTVQRGDIVGGAMANYGQTKHGKPVIGGYLSRARDEDILWLREVPGIKYLSCPVCPGFPDSEDLNPDAVRRVLNDLRIKYVVYHKVDFEGLPTSYEREGTAAAIQDYLETVGGLLVVEADESYVAYRNEGVK